jgi:FMN phosphatase YigB (HAD superfamily)
MRRRRHDTVIFFDVDNTLLNNDAIVLDLRGHLRQEFGRRAEKRYFEIFEKLRAALGYTDYLGALQRYRLEHPWDPHLLRMSSFLINYPFAKRLFPKAMEVVRHARRATRTVILSDGDAVFQPRKIERSGLAHAVNRDVLIFIHKEKALRDVRRLVPARHYIMVDDKLRILDAMKRQWGNRLTTVFVRQGHYALDLKAIAPYRPADVSIARIGDFLKIQETLLRRAHRVV